MRRRFHRPAPPLAFASPCRAPRPQACLVLLTALVASTLCACSLFVASADREVNRLLDARMEQVDRHRAATMSYPTELLDQEQGGPAREAGDDDAPPGDKPSAQTPEIARIDLPHALALAFASSPDYLDSREALYQQGLGFTLTSAITSAHSSTGPSATSGRNRRMVFRRTARRQVSAPARFCQPAAPCRSARGYSARGRTTRISFSRTGDSPTTCRPGSASTNRCSEGPGTPSPTKP